MTANHGHTFQPHVVTAVRDNIAKHYGDLYYCARDESAWSYGTMSLEDFHTIAHDDDVLDGLTESALEVLSGELAAAEQREKEQTEQAIYELTEAIRFTVEYVGNDTLPPIDGWSWFDALRKYRPELAEHFEQNPQLRPDNRVTREIIAEQIRDRAGQEGDDE